MRPWWGAVGACALALWSGEIRPAAAAWDNAFQVCCHSCRSRPSTSGYSSYYAAPSGCCAPSACCDPCPQQVCTTRYVQRCYYQPVTSYTTKVYYEPVTSYRTSYYYEPVTSYRYNSYYDPCTGCYSQVACPTTSYRLRSQCCPVTSYLKRCCQVPVTTYQAYSYYEPVTSCCTTTPCCPTSYSAPCTESAPAQQPQQPAAQPQQPAGVQEHRAMPQPGVQETPKSNGNGSSSPLYDRYYGPSDSKGAETHQQSKPRAPAFLPPPAAPTPPPAVRLDRIVSAPVAPRVLGQVVRQDNAPRSGAKLVFVNLQSRDRQQQVTADQSGQFRVTLASGGWLVYVHDSSDRLVYHSRVDLREGDEGNLTLVSR